MLTEDGFVQVLRIEADPQLAIGFSVVHEAIYPLRWFASAHLSYDPLLFHLRQFLLDVILQLEGNSSWRVNNRWHIRVNRDVVCSIELSNAMEIFRVLTFQAVSVCDATQHPAWQNSINLPFRDLAVELDDAEFLQCWKSEDCWF